jgi:hypothetical protein
LIIRYSICSVLALAAWVVYIASRKSPPREIAVSGAIALVGFVIWLSIIAGWDWNLSTWIAWLIDRTRL